MARKYSRDNRGRFASGGGGATARGGRLRTAAGNKRATQTMKAAGGGGDGVIRGRAARTVAGESVMRKLPKAARKDYTSKEAIATRRSRLSNDGTFIPRARGTKRQKAQTSITRQNASTVYSVQETLRNTGRLTEQTVRKGTPIPMGKPRPAKPAAPAKAKAAPKAPAKAASKAEKAIEAAKARLKKPQYIATANQAQGRVIDRRVAAMTPRQFAGNEVRAARAMAKRTRRALKDPINATAPARWRDAMQRSLADNVKTFKDAAKDYRRVVPKARRK